MAPNFFSKLVRPNNGSSSSHERTGSSPSPTPSSSGRRSFSAFRNRAQSNAGDTTSGNNSQEEIPPVPPVPSISAQFASVHNNEKEASEDASANYSPQTNVIVVPPSPSMASTAEMRNDYESSLFNRPIDGLPASSDGGAGALMSKLEPATTTSATTTTIHAPHTTTPSSSSATTTQPAPSRPSSAHSQRPPQSPPSSSAAEPAAPTPTMSFLLSPAALRHSSSNKSLNQSPSTTTTTTTSPNNSSIRNRSATTPAAHMAAVDTALDPAPPPPGIVMTESPTSELPPKSLGEASNNINIPRSPSFSNLFASKDKDSDAASVMTSTKKKQRSPTGWKRQPNSKPTGLAGAIAASGLAMVNPGMTSPHHQLAPSATLSTGPRSRSRANSINAAPASRSGSPSTTMSRNGGGRKKGHKKNAPSTSGMSDVTSDLNYDEHGVLLTTTTGTLDYYSGLDDDSSDDDSDDVSADEALRDLEYGDDEIPVTGFAVASSRRNQEFHEMFTSVPAEDYLIEDYGCALQREILLQGRLYISENHICFHANIFGWVTDVVIAITDIKHLEKKMTAFVIPNAILISTHDAKHSFTSFLSRDTTYDVIYNIWRLVRPGGADSASMISGRGSVDAGGDTIAEGTIIGPGGTGLLVDGDGKVKPKETSCACGKEGKHYTAEVMNTVFPGTPDKIHALMFQSGFMKDFFTGSQKLFDLEMGDWSPREPGSTLLARNMSYIKPLNGSIGPKQTKCEIRDETDHADFEHYVSMITTTKNPDVPSGGAFAVKTRSCLTWASAMSTKVVVTTQVEWSGRSFIKGVIDRSALEGQKQYHVDLEKEVRAYIQAHKSEFLPEGVDPDMLTPAAAAGGEPTEAEKVKDRAKTSGVDGNDDDAGKKRERERNQRSLQWAWDTFEGAQKVATDSASGAWELLSDSWDQSSSTTILYLLIVALIISNVYTFTRMGKREDVGRKKEMLQREKFVQGVVSALWDELSVGMVQHQNQNQNQQQQQQQQQRPLVPAPASPGEVKEEMEVLGKTMDQVEERMRELRRALEVLNGTQREEEEVL